MELTVEELNELLQKEFERGKKSNIMTSGFSQIKELKPYTSDAIPEACKSCPNHPINGGSGICHCVLGNTVTYSTANVSTTANND